MEKAGISIARVVSSVPVEQEELRRFIDELKREGIDAVVAAALPVQLLVELQRHFPVFLLKMKQVAAVSNRDEAERLVKEAPDRRVALPPARGNEWRVVEFVGVARVRVQLEEELVATP